MKSHRDISSAAGNAMNKSSLLSAQNLRKRFKAISSGSSSAFVTALDGVSITLSTGQSLGIAGESGCGKSTLGKILAGLLPADEGDVLFRGKSITTLGKEERKEFRQTTQMIFQDPFSSLNPRMRVGEIIREPLLLAGKTTAEQESLLKELMMTVGLSADMAERFPDEFSGGQRQRIGIARALAASPKLLIADEPVSALDISIQAQIINLLQEMKQSFELSLILISHNLSVLHHLCDRIVIMYLGVIVEDAPADKIFSGCRHPYTEALLSAIPSINNTRKTGSIILTDDLPSPLAIPDGCRFHPRCHYVQDRCLSEVPDLKSVSNGHFSACHFSQNMPN